MAETLEATEQVASSTELKPGWRVVRFGGVVSNVDVSERQPLEQGLERFVGLDHLDPESLHIKRWGLIEEGTSFTRKFVSGQVLFGKRRAYQRKAAVAEFDGICSGDILVFEPKGDELLPELLPFIVQSDGFFEHALGTSAGSLSPRTKWSDLARYEFALPPKDEQRRIADILWAADDVVKKDLVSQEALAQFQTVQTEQFLSKGMQGWHSRYVKTPIGSLPESWQCLSCNDLFSEKPRNGLSPEANAEGVGYPTLSIGAVRDGQIVAEGNVKYAVIGQDEAEKFQLKKGDVLIVRGNGNRNLVGRCGVVDDVPEGCFYPDLLIRIKFDETKLRSQFACLQWNSSTAHRRLLARAKSTNGIWKVNGQDLRQHTLAVPHIEEQDAFLRMVEPNFKLTKQTQEKVNSSRTLKKRLVNSLISFK